MIILLALGCTADPKTTDTSIKEANYIGILHREDGWLRGDLHIHSTHSDGYDDVATDIAIAE